eukprot:Nk52_evm23s2506 gene=Nk52_evmTU23s2506
MDEGAGARVREIRALVGGVNCAPWIESSLDETLLPETPWFDKGGAYKHLVEAVVELCVRDARIGSRERGEYRQIVFEILGEKFVKRHLLPGLNRDGEYFEDNPMLLQEPYMDRDLYEKLRGEMIDFLSSAIQTRVKEGNYFESYKGHCRDIFVQGLLRNLKRDMGAGQCRVSESVGNAFIQLSVETASHGESFNRLVFGHYLPRNLRQHLWLTFLYRDPGMFERDAKSVYSHMKLYNLSDPHFSSIASLIKRATREIYVHTRGLSRYNVAERHKLACQVINIYYILTEDYDTRHIYLLVPFLLCFEDVLTSMQICSLYNRFHSRCLPNISAVFAMADEALAHLKRLNPRLHSFLIETARKEAFQHQEFLVKLLELQKEREREEAKKMGLPVPNSDVDDDDNDTSDDSKQSNKNKNSSFDLSHPVIFIRKWIGECFMSVLDPNAALFVWDQCFLENNWAMRNKNTGPKYSHLLVEFAVSIILLLENNIYNTATNYKSLRDCLILNPSRLYTYDIRRAWECVHFNTAIDQIAKMNTNRYLVEVNVPLPDKDEGKEEEKEEDEELEEKGLSRPQDFFSLGGAFNLGPDKEEQETEDESVANSKEEAEQQGRGKEEECVEEPATETDGGYPTLRDTETLDEMDAFTEPSRLTEVDQVPIAESSTAEGESASPDEEMKKPAIADEKKELTDEKGSTSTKVSSQRRVKRPARSTPEKPTMMILPDKKSREKKAYVASQSKTETSGTSTSPRSSFDNSEAERKALFSSFTNTSEDDSETDQQIGEVINLAALPPPKPQTAVSESTVSEFQSLPNESAFDDLSRDDDTAFIDSSGIDKPTEGLKECDFDSIEGSSYILIDKLRMLPNNCSLSYIEGYFVTKKPDGVIKWSSVGQRDSLREDSGLYSLMDEDGKFRLVPKTDSFVYCPSFEAAIPLSLGSDAETTPSVLRDPSLEVVLNCFSLDRFELTPVFIGSVFVPVFETSLGYVQLNYGAFQMPLMLHDSESTIPSSAKGCKKAMCVTALIRISNSSLLDKKSLTLMNGKSYKNKTFVILSNVSLPSYMAASYSTSRAVPNVHEMKCLNYFLRRSKTSVYHTAKMLLPLALPGFSVDTLKGGEMNAHIMQCFRTKQAKLPLPILTFVPYEKSIGLFVDVCMAQRLPQAIFTNVVVRYICSELHSKDYTLSPPLVINKHDLESGLKNPVFKGGIQQAPIQNVYHPHSLMVIVLQGVSSRKNPRLVTQGWTVMNLFDVYRDYDDATGGAIVDAETNSNANEGGRDIQRGRFNSVAFLNTASDAIDKNTGRMMGAVNGYTRAGAHILPLFEGEPPLEGIHQCFLAGSVAEVLGPIVFPTSGGKKKNTKGSAGIHGGLESVTLLKGHPSLHISLYDGHFKGMSEYSSRLPHGQLQLMEQMTSGEQKKYGQVDIKKKDPIVGLMARKARGDKRERVYFEDSMNAIFQTLLDRNNSDIVTGPSQVTS